MRLEVRAWGDGPRTAVLVHGYSDDSGTWWRVAPALAEQGFTVLAPDLRGHGASPRCGSYGLAEFAQDLVDSVPVGVDLVVGHSLGALVVGMAAGRLQPARVVFVDPSWLRPLNEVELRACLPTAPEDLPAECADWAPGDVAAEVASNGRLDPRIARGLLASLAPHEHLPPSLPPYQGALVLVPELGPALPLSAHPALEELGYRIRTLPGAGHVLHRDDFDGFMALLRPELPARAVPA